MLTHGSQAGHGKLCLGQVGTRKALGDEDKHMFEVLLFTIRRANQFFRTLRCHGIWVTEPDRSVAVAAGRDMNAPCFNQSALHGFIAVHS